MIKNFTDQLFYETLKILSDLIKFKTVSGTSNLNLIDYCENKLKSAGANSIKTYNDSKNQANLFSTIGKNTDSDLGGIILSGHTDVVPAVSKDWSSDPFIATEKDNKVFGRGTCDMKGFIACTLAVAPLFSSKKLKRPIHFSYTFDEETGCLGAPIILEDLNKRNIRFSSCIIGEPTNMKAVNANKGYNEYKTHFIGLSGHASNPERGVSAIEIAILYSNKLMELRDELKKRSKNHKIFFPSYSTLQIGKITGGIGANVIADQCSLEWEVRPINKDDSEFVNRSIDDFTKNILLPKIKKDNPKGDIHKEIIGEVVGFNKTESSEAVNLVCNLTGDNSIETMAFGTEAGLFQNNGISTVICGPGSIEQAHTVDEFISHDQLKKCLKMLISLQEKISS
ncbi:MAG: acetylornithine deacetylase [Pelagibacteraceae bacterium]|nr:acetylornithine deacetylase [Pelagibacteraceae bacterium]|tara:strand:+ start:4389 stop:5576 length:1188 start_codon:yes stop_codon:yes gene_type:complete